MSNLIKGFTGGVLFLIVFSFITGSFTWMALDVLNIEIKNLSGGEPGKLSINYWNAIFGSGFLLIAVSIVKTFVSTIYELSDNRDEDEK